jgi:hypothetical protein
MSQEDLTRLLAGLPTSATLPVGWIREKLIVVEPVVRMPEPAPVPESSWRERIWTCPPETRLGISEIAEALGRSKSWCYKHTGASAEDRLPVRKLDGEVVVTAGDLRAWIEAHEDPA